MVNSRLYEVFDALPKKELKEVRKFIHSPFFNQREHVRSLFDFLIATKFENKVPPNREAAFEYLFPGTPFDDHKLRLSISLLLKSIEKYLIVNELLDDKSEMQINLATAYRRLNLKRHFQKTISVYVEQNSKQAVKNAEFYWQQYHFFEEQYLFNKEQSRMAEDLKLKEMHENLDIAYLSSKLKQSCFSLAHQTIHKKEYDFGMLEEVIVYVEQNSFFKIPAIETYYLGYKLLSNTSDQSIFKRFKTSIIEYQNYFPKAELRDLFLLATNYCIQQMNRGARTFAKEGLDIYKAGLESHVLFLEGYLSRFTYRNIVAMAIVSKEYDWADKFLYNYKDKLEKKHKEATFSFNLAWLEYERQNYDVALELINKANFSDILLNLSAKTIAMKIYFELGAFDLLYSHLEAMKTFIHRKKIIGYHKENYLNTIKFMKKILDTPKEDATAINQIHNNIQSEIAIAEKSWLLNQLK